ncbi:muconolactone Delta-isomerase family protein [Nostoc sp. UHCC 0926]|nr:muconolactone Delta-isomerase family protein [Nostoc sp. UHCC 0926]WDD33909.1 muconolactone Delta-isomerase family protein [Nostoc sp. UHCC 0926]
MQYLVIFTPKQKFASPEMPSDFPQLLLEEEARAKDLYMEGLLRQSWVLGARDRGAAVLFEAESPERLQEIIDSFPLIKADYSDTQVFPLAPDPAFANKS